MLTASHIRQDNCIKGGGILDNITLGLRLLKFRKLNNYTQKEIGKYLNIERQTYSNYERGVRTPDMSTLSRLAQLYHISMDELLIPEPGPDDHIPASVQEGPAPFGQSRMQLSGKEARLIIDYRSLSEPLRENLLRYLRFLKTESDNN